MWQSLQFCLCQTPGWRRRGLRRVPCCLAPCLDCPRHRGRQAMPVRAALWLPRAGQTSSGLGRAESPPRHARAALPRAGRRGCGWETEQNSFRLPSSFPVFLQTEKGSSDSCLVLAYPLPPRHLALLTHLETILPEDYSFYCGLAVIYIIGGMVAWRGRNLLWKGLPSHPIWRGALPSLVPLGGHP